MALGNALKRDLWLSVIVFHFHLKVIHSNSQSVIQSASHSASQSVSHLVIYSIIHSFIHSWSCSWLATWICGRLHKAWLFSTAKLRFGISSLFMDVVVVVVGDFCVCISCFVLNYKARRYNNAKTQNWRPLSATMRIINFVVPFIFIHIFLFQIFYSSILFVSLVCLFVCLFVRLLWQRVVNIHFVVLLPGYCPTLTHTHSHTCTHSLIHSFISFI